MAQNCTDLKCPFVPYCKDFSTTANHAKGCPSFDGIVAAAKLRQHLIKPIVTLPISVTVSGTFIYLRDLLPYITVGNMTDLIRQNCRGYESTRLNDDTDTSHALVTNAIKPHANIASFLSSLLPAGVRFCEFAPTNPDQYLRYNGAIFYPDEIIGKPGMPCSQRAAADALTDLLLSCTDRSYMYATNCIKHGATTIYSCTPVPETQLIMLATSDSHDPTKLRFTIADRTSMLPINEQPWVKYPSDITYPGEWNATLPDEVYYQPSILSKPTLMQVSIKSVTNHATKTPILQCIDPITDEPAPYVPSDFTNMANLARWLNRRKIAIV